MAPHVFPAPVYPSMESLPVDSPLRQLYPEDLYPNGSYFKSPYGKIRYYLLGPTDGRKVVLVHGVSVPSIAYRNIGTNLAERGFRVLLYDLYGRGYSESPKDNLDTVNLYILQLALLLQFVGWTKTAVIGFSLGGAIAAAFASTFPHLVDGKVVFLASAGLLDRPRDGSGKVKPVQTKNLDPSQIAMQLRQLQEELLPGFRVLVSHDLRDGPGSGLNWAFKTVGESEHIQALIIHGNADNLVPYGEASKIKALVPQATIVTIDGASHYLVFEDGHWQQVADSIAAFI